MSLAVVLYCKISLHAPFLCFRRDAFLPYRSLRKCSDIELHHADKQVKDKVPAFHLNYLTAFASYHSHFKIISTLHPP
jgi:hypothetical protein